MVSYLELALACALCGLVGLVAGFLLAAVAAAAHELEKRD
jgi:hypothetical protein